MNKAELEARIDELQPAAEEFFFLQTVLRHIDEGLIEMDDEGRCFAVEDTQLQIPLSWEEA